jgi:acylphosphatase
MNGRKSAHILVLGRVEGVGFRYYVKNVADQTGVTGWVRNRFDERVEILAQGDQEKMEKFIALVRVGPSASLVTDMAIEWCVADPAFSKFSIAPTF